MSAYGSGSNAYGAGLMFPTKARRRTSAASTSFGAPPPGSGLGGNVPDDIGDNSSDYGQDDSYSGQSVAGSGVTGAGGSGNSYETEAERARAAQRASAAKGGANMGSNGFGFGQAGRVGTYQNLGSARLKNSSVNWGAFAGIANWLGQPGDPLYAQKAAYLRSVGLMPTYNGMTLDTLNTRASMPGGLNVGGTGGGTSGGAMLGWNPQQIADRIQGQTQADAYYAQVPQGVQAVSGGFARLRPGADPSKSSSWERTDDLTKWGYASTPKAGGGAGAALALGGGLQPGGTYSGGSGGGSLGGGDDYGAGDTYRRLIANGGSLLTPEQSAALRNRTTSTVARSTNDALQAARLDAARRGDFSGSTLSDTEARIRRRGANDVVKTGLDYDVAEKQSNMQNLLAALGGAGSLYGLNLGALTEQQKIALMQGQLEAQGLTGIGGGLNTILSMKG